MDQVIRIEIYSADCSKDPRALELLSVRLSVSFSVRQRLVISTACTNVCAVPGLAPWVVVNGTDLGRIGLVDLVDYLHLLAMGHQPFVQVA